MCNRKKAGIDSFDRVAMYQELKIHFDSIPHNLIRKSKWASLAFFSFSYPVRDGHELPIKRSPTIPTHPPHWVVG
jgi:hypothetical protein